MKYRLFFKETEIGTIEQKDEDFPNTFGVYQLSPGIAKANTLVSQYISYSIESSLLLEGDQEKYEELIESEGSKYIELIEAVDWKLIDDQSKTHPILIPDFCSDDEVVWRWRF